MRPCRMPATPPGPQNCYANLLIIEQKPCPLLPGRGKRLSITACTAYAPAMLTNLFLQMPGHYIRRAQQVSSAYFTEELADSELTAVQMVALVVIVDNPGIDATRLSEVIDFDRATIGGVVDRLERKGLIQRVVNSQDKRSKVMRATPAGKALLDVSLPRVKQVQERILAPLDPEDRETFLRLIKTIIGSQTD